MNAIRKYFEKTLAMSGNETVENGFREDQTENIEILKSNEHFDQLKYDESAVVSRALNKVQSDKSPHIALVGDTNVGKSALSSRLFGGSIFEAGDDEDFTDRVSRVEFESGLVLYDTPGIFSNDLYENVTRMFLGLPQIGETLEHIDALPIRYYSSNANSPSDYDEDNYLTPQQIEEQITIDAIIWVVKLDGKIPEGRTGKPFFAFRDNLYKKMSHRVVIAGTHLDALRDKVTAGKVDPEYIEKRINKWEEKLQSSIIPVTAIDEGEGLEELVEEILYKISDRISPSSFREALAESQRFDRLTQVINVISGVLSDVATLKGDHLSEITQASMYIFGFVALLYSVEEDVWERFQGDAEKIAEEISNQHTETRKYTVQEIRTTRKYKTETRRRNAKPYNPIEWIGSIVQWATNSDILTEDITLAVDVDYTVDVEKTKVIYNKIGIEGINSLITRTYQLIAGYEGVTKEFEVLSDETIRQIVFSVDALHGAINREEKLGLQNSIREIMNKLFEEIK